jgi:thioredoxin 1
MKEKTTWIMLVIIFFVIIISAFAITNNNLSDNQDDITSNSNTTVTSGNYHVTNSSNSTVVSNNIEWYKNLDEGLNVAQKEHKPLFVAFQASWCPYCQKMNSETYTDVNVQDKINNNYVPVIIDGDNHPDLCSKYGVKGYPTIVILDQNGQQTKHINSFQSANDLLNQI